MHRTRSASTNAGLRAGALLGIVALGLISIVGSGGGIAFLPSDCPPGLDCSGSATPVPVLQPARVTAQVGTPVTFSVLGLNVPASQVTYQWYRSSDGGVHYVAIAGATGDTLLLASVNLADDGAIFKVTASANGLSGSAVSHVAVTASPGLVFADGEFPAAGWLATPLPIGSVPAPAHTEELVATGGHPGAYLTMVFQLASQAGMGGVAYTSLAGTYEPQTQGAVYVIDYSEDGISLETSFSKSTRSAMLLDQGGRKYIATPSDSYPRLATSWDVSQNTPSLRAQDFTLLDGPACQAGETCPDFSSLGAPMRFGYWRLSSGPQGASISHGIDNWKVTVWRR
ncbi:MAG TPA: hypothetical protein VII31_05820 [Caldimonas sp.]